MSNTNSCYNCDICNKKYSSNNSLWNHNKKFHNDNVTNKSNYRKYNVTNPITTSVTNHVTSITNPVTNPVTLTNLSTPTIIKKYNCKYCNKNFNHRQNRYEHEKKCKQKNELIIQNTEIQNNLQLNNNLQLTDNKTINDNKIINNNINNGVINNNTTINYIINSVGCENIEKLTFEEIKKIFRQHKNCLYHAIDFVNFNENIPENHNFYNSSLEGKYINVFNVETNSPEKKNKKDFFDKLLMSSLNIMNLLYEKVKDSVSPIKKKSLKKMINELDKIAHLDNHKKIYALNVNQISYNKKEIVKKSWSEKKKQDKNNLIEDTNYDSESDNNNKYIDSDSDTESKDSFYYLTEEDSESELENNNEDD
jgi:hypothetical protein